ncbi:MAG TPA: RND transporter [Alteromonas macleodii]|nr:efflux transporter outer membrane subunit [Alteromonas macleodii]MAW02833.1 RND transporter [Alteromonas sp.]MCH2255983.1 efflux transporter outer membrane subunit [Alteromonas sp.]RZP33297.1 MAG: efflux transporter outer membrane subunit [Alteromonas sp.]HBO00800.1 RND transporter [Alteromonas macleodii]HCY27178.1 RND transporter [Alteromonas macleodii]|tara:strand:+ start:1116 stop:2570 length:1455 start_codon:yes stop_codon:yes gene_type:complete
MGKIKLTVNSITLCILLSACTSTDDRALSESASSSTGNNVVWQSQAQQQESTQTLLLNSDTTLIDVIDIKELPHLAGYIDEALSSNASLQQSLITLRKAQVAIDSAKADRNLNVDASFSASKSETTNSSASTSSNTNSSTSSNSSSPSYSASMNVSWELDLWQKISDGISAANLDAASARASYQSARDSLVANVVRSYIDVLTQQQLLNIEQSRLTVLENNEAVILKRYSTGLGSLDDLDTARTSSANTRATIAQYENALLTAKRTLAVLLGRQNQSLNELNTQVSFPDVLLPLTTLPKQDLARRPDLQAAFYALKATEFEVDVAYKALLPSISLSASLSDNASTPSQALFTNPLWSLLGQMTAPLFHGGALRAQIEDAKLTSANAWWQYRETLLTAVQETQNALDSETALSARISHTNVALANAERSVSTIEGQYRQGLADILDLLSVYDTRFNLQAQAVELHAQKLQNRIDLGLALGLGVSQ